MAKTLAFFPCSAYHELTGMSGRNLVYDDEPIKHRFLVIFEAAGMAGDLTSYFLRSLLSENRLRYKTTQKTKDGQLESRLIEREGPTGLLVTTTSASLHPENETRMLSLLITDTKEQTRRVISAEAEELAAEVDYEPWHALQTWLEASECREVFMPFAAAVAKAIPDSALAVRLRRDFNTLLSLVRSHALLHQASRERDEKGRIVATLDD